MSENLGEGAIRDLLGSIAAGKGGINKMIDHASEISRYSLSLLAQLESLRAENEAVQYKLRVRTAIIEGKNGWREENEALRTRWTEALNLVRRKADEWANAADLTEWDSDSKAHEARLSLHKATAARELLQQLEQLP